MADAQIEKSYQKQHGMNTYNEYLLYGVEPPKYKKKAVKGKAGKSSRIMSHVRYFKKVGLGFQTPADAINAGFVDKKCPFTGNVSIRGRILKGMCTSTKMKRTITVRRDFLLYIKKYSRYAKRHTSISAHCSPAFKRIKEGDIVTVGQCRPLSKTVRFNVLKVQPNQIFGSVKKQFMLF